VNRIAVVGAGGAGKSRLSRALGQTLDLPVVHLDAHYYGPGWQPLPLVEWADRQRQLAAGERWVMDGNYASTLDLRLERADMIVYLDLPPLLCAWQVLRRWALGHRRPVPDLPPGLRPKIDRRFLWYVLTFRRRRPGLLAELGQRDRGTAIVILRSHRQVRRFLSRLRSH
jgi:adenylate kinase family enzyme